MHRRYRSSLEYFTSLLDKLFVIIVDKYFDWLIKYMIINK